MWGNKVTAAATFLLLSSCSTMGTDSPMHCGTFEGILPAADGPGIQTTLVLNSDSSFKEHSVYINRPSNVFDETGTYMVRGNMVELHLGGGERNYYRIENDQLRRLSMEQKPITGGLADYYVLTKTKSCH